MKLEDIGYSTVFEKCRQEQGLTDFGVARVSAEHRDRYHVMDEEGEKDAEVIGNLRFAAKSRLDFPAVGDWVAVSAYDSDKVIIHSVFPRTTVLEREAVGKHGEKQLIACNIDRAWIVQAVDRDFNLNRLERYLTICYESKITPLILLSKTDLIAEDELQSLKQQLIERIGNIPVVAVSNLTRGGFEALRQHIRKGCTYCLLGSSGVGKSTLLNTLANEKIMETREISSSTNKGKHTTSHRQLHILPDGGIFIDNPGIREVGIADSVSGMELTFREITLLASECRYSDCSHAHEEGCAVIAAVQQGKIDDNTYRNFLRMERESEHFSLSQAEKRKKDKDLGKFIKDFKKNKKHISNKHDD
ncbi:MAG: ribosome small subunit-dependent GTPase A [Bacteroidales bacterium]|nr:ribosome small subunit-dependent GTPase A [Bacteroidales bacterium]